MLCEEDTIDMFLLVIFGLDTGCPNILKSATQTNKEVYTFLSTILFCV